MSDPSKPQEKPPAPIPTPVPSVKEDQPPLTEEEQMALFEAALKEEDWGHQPC